VPKLQKLINAYAKKNLLLPRSLNDLYEKVRDFWVWEEKGKLLGCCALHVVWQDLAEIRSLAVAEARQKKGLGRKLLLSCLAEARKLKIKKVFTLSYIPAYFRKFGFKTISKSKLPHKIWSECIRCVKYHNDCDEIALMKRL
jgi:amino-acid N-acetyltransferase